MSEIKSFSDYTSKYKSNVDFSALFSGTLDSSSVGNETSFYANEKNEISGICNQFLNGKTDQKLFCNEMKDRLNDYYGSRYELRNQPESVESRVNNMLSKLQHMYAL